MKQPDSLFDRQLDSGTLDSTYIHVRDCESCEKDRAYLDAAWQVFRPHADVNFAKEFRRPKCFQSRAWELRLAWTLRDVGLSFSGPKPGPDFAIQARNHTIFIEAIAPDATESLIANYEAARGSAACISDDEIILRYTAAISEKLRKLREYRRSGAVGHQDPYVIAISGANIPQSSIEARPFPRVLMPLFAIGEAYFGVPVDGSGKTTHGIHRQGERTTLNGSAVSCHIFLADGDRELSAVIFAAWDIKNRPEMYERPPGNDFTVVHNPYAENPIETGMIPRGREWAVRDGNLQLLKDWRST